MNKRAKLSILSCVAAALLLAAAGCGDEGGGGPGTTGVGRGEPCETETDCLAGLTCHGGICDVCPTPCGSDCCWADNQECVEGVCVAGCETVMCAGVCCGADEVCINDLCCPAGRKCGDQCCWETEQCGADGCVPCLTSLCGGLCCPDGEECWLGVCCAEDNKCAGACCEDGFACVRGECLIDCGGNVRCGDLCCEASQVCYLEGCLLPGGTCESHFDCGEDEYCEPSIGRCLPLAEGDETCEYRPPVEEFSPTMEWHWEGYSGNPDFHNVLSLPLAGDVDGDGLPEIVVTAYNDDCHNGLAVVLNGEDGSEAWAIDDLGFRFDAAAHGALADVDGDLKAEIVLPLCSGGVALFDDNGDHLWTYEEGTAATALYTGGVAIGDINKDGSPDIVFGGAVIEANGGLLADYGPLGSNWDTTDGRSAYIPSLYDMNADTILDLVGGGRVLSGADGSALLDLEVPGHGFTAVGDFGSNGSLEIVSISSGSLYVLAALDGAILMSSPIPTPGIDACLSENRGGAPTIADFDNDGEPEIAAAGCGFYTVYDLACTPEGDPALCPSGRLDGILWSMETRDYSSSATGSSVFDFEADGKAEVLYNDECHLRAYEGSTGRVIFEVANSSRTGTEYPVIADVDGDGSAEIVVGANDDQIIRDACEVGTHGVFVYGDSLSNWVRTRPVWNEHAYHVTNVNADGSVPIEEEPNFSADGLNNFRQNVQTEGIFNTSNLVPADMQAEDLYCPGRYIIKVRVVNLGSAGVGAGVPVGFYEGTPAGVHTLLGMSTTREVLLPGMSELVSFTWEVPPEEERSEFTFYAVVDDVEASGTEIAVHECNEDDNVSATVDVICTVVL
ncbi:MAG: VCBS repeat-containing protein [Pseudomonadota bacterium]